MIGRVLCINDKGQPEGAEVEAGKEYPVLESFMNNWGHRTLLLQGVKNEGRTSKGLMWRGYQATRFVDLEKVSSVESEEVYQEEDMAILN